MVGVASTSRGVSQRFEPDKFKPFLIGEIDMALPPVHELQTHG